MAPSTHLVILLHGAWGHPVHLHSLRDTLVHSHQSEVDDGSLVLLLPNASAGNLTYDGIEVCAERITTEIEEKISTLATEDRPVGRISIIGYSMGGLIARYVVGVLQNDGVFDKVEPVNFTTFATPHLGVRTPKNDYGSTLWDSIAAKALSVSGEQMFLADEFRDSGRGLLDIMADPSKVFLQGLKRFKNKTGYANTINDRSVPYYTSAISRVDPFVDLDAVEVNYLEGQTGEKVLLDPENPVQPRPADALPVTLRERYLSPRALSNIPFYAAVFTALPIVLPLFFVNAGYQTYRSTNRIRLHESGSQFDLKRYRIPLLEEAQAMQDRIVERVAGQSQEGYLPTPPPENATSTGSSITSENNSHVKLAREQSHMNDSPFPTLALSKEQFSMVEGLKSSGIVIYPCHITQSRHTHAAIVVRSPKEAFHEGRVVVKHWATNFEV
nr:putative lipase [Quercus suber]